MQEVCLVSEDETKRRERVGEAIVSRKGKGKGQEEEKGVVTHPFRHPGPDD